MKKISAESFEQVETIWEGLSKTAHAISDTCIMYNYPNYGIDTILNDIGHAQGAFHKVVLHVEDCKHPGTLKNAPNLSEAKEYYKRALSYVKKHLTTISALRTANFVEPEVREVMDAVWKNINKVIIHMESDTYFS